MMSVGMLNGQVIVTVNVAVFNEPTELVALNYTVSVTLFVVSTSSVGLLMKSKKVPV